MPNHRLARCHNLEDLRREARRRAHPMVFDYLDGGADDEVTLRRNSRAFADYELLFRVLVGVDAVDSATTVLGTPCAVPIIASPSAGNRLFHTEGEIAVARAAAEAGMIYCLSTLSSASMEAVAAASQGPKWFQLYVWKDRGLVREMLQRARAAGYGALILTVDFPITGNRERDLRNQLLIPPKIRPRHVWQALTHPRWTLDYLRSPAIRYANLSEDQPAASLADFVAAQLHAGFDWHDVEWLLGEWSGPSLIKGVVRADDATRAVAAGFNGIMISNHGGRQLDHSPAPIDVLASIVDAAAGRAEVILDGGVRRGTDVLKALALGARAVSAARPYLYGLAAGGHAGVRRAFELLTTAVRRDMALLGIRTPAEIDASFIRRLRAPASLQQDTRT